MEDIKKKREKINKEVKKQRNRKLYERRREERVLCESCACYVDKYGFDKHILTKKHKTRLELSKNSEAENY